MSHQNTIVTYHSLNKMATIWMVASSICILLWKLLWFDLLTCVPKTVNIVAVYSFALNRHLPELVKIQFDVTFICHQGSMSYSTTICKLVDLIPALHQSDCRIPN